MLTTKNSDDLSRRGVLVPTVFTLAAIGVLVALGSWQLERKAWKEKLIATVAQRLAAPPASLPPKEKWPTLDPEEYEYRRVGFSAELLGDREALVYTAGSAFRRDVTGIGYWVLTPARLSDGTAVVVDRGFIPIERKDPATRSEGNQTGAVEVIGVIRFPEPRGLFTPNDEPNNNVWYARDPALIGAQKNWGTVPPFYIEQESPQPPGGLPRPGALSVALPNNHLQYAITWFGLAAVFAASFLFWLRSRRRDAG